MDRMMMMMMLRKWDGGVGDWTSSGRGERRHFVFAEIDFESIFGCRLRRFVVDILVDFGIILEGSGFALKRFQQLVHLTDGGAVRRLHVRFPSADSFVRIHKWRSGVA